MLADPVVIDLCALLLNAPRWHLALRILQEDGHEIVAVSFLDRKTTRTALRKIGLLEHFDDVCYGFVPLGPRLQKPWEAIAQIRCSRYTDEVKKILDLRPTLVQSDSQSITEDFSNGKGEEENGPSE